MELFFSPFGIALPPVGRARRDASLPGGWHRHVSPSALFAVFRQWRRRAYERHLLAQFGERERRDIALTPADIAVECAKPFWRP